MAKKQSNNKDLTASLLQQQQGTGTGTDADHHVDINNNSNNKNSKNNHTHNHNHHRDHNHSHPHQHQSNSYQNDSDDASHHSEESLLQSVKSVIPGALGGKGNPNGMLCYARTLTHHAIRLVEVDVTCDTNYSIHYPMSHYILYTVQQILGLHM
jgi:hypothetical protein